MSDDTFNDCQCHMCVMGRVAQRANVLQSQASQMQQQRRCIAKPPPDTSAYEAMSDEELAACVIAKSVALAAKSAIDEEARDRRIRRAACVKFMAGGDDWNVNGTSFKEAVEAANKLRAK